jgi:hypothetical protein
MDSATRWTQTEMFSVKCDEECTAFRKPASLRKTSSPSDLTRPDTALRLVEMAPEMRVVCGKTYVKTGFPAMMTRGDKDSGKEQQSAILRRAQKPK